MKDKPLINICVYGIIKNTKGQILFVKRAEHDSHPGIWELPGGGIDFLEEPKDSVKRELKEETNLDVIVKNPVKVFSTKNNKKQTIRIVFHCKAEKFDNIILSNDHSEYKWITTKDYSSFYEPRI